MHPKCPRIPIRHTPENVFLTILFEFFAPRSGTLPTSTVVPLPVVLYSHTLRRLQKIGMAVLCWNGWDPNWDLETFGNPEGRAVLDISEDTSAILMKIGGQ